MDAKKPVLTKRTGVATWVSLLLLVICQQAASAIAAAALPATSAAWDSYVSAFLALSSASKPAGIWNAAIVPERVERNSPTAA